MKTLVLGDIHITEKAIPEIQKILDEVCFGKKWNRIILLGDLLDKKRPSPIELDFCTFILTKMLTICPVTIVTGNHEDLSDTVSELDFSRHFGIELLKHHDAIEMQGKKIYLGHHFLDTGEIHRQDTRFKTKELSQQYDLVLLGHDHGFKKEAENVFFLGSVRRCSFSEVSYGCPKYGIVTLESSQSLQINVYDIKSAIPMMDVFSVKECLKIDPRTKVRLVFTRFEDFLANINKLKKLQQKFHTFTVKNDYKQNIVKVAKKKKKTKSFDEYFQNFLKTIKDKKVKTFIENTL